jgi:hypothetical protein
VIPGLLTDPFDLYDRYIGPAIRPALPPAWRDWQPTLPPEWGVALIVAGAVGAAAWTYHSLRVENAKLTSRLGVAAAIRSAREVVARRSEEGQILSRQLRALPKGEQIGEAESEWRSRAEIWANSTYEELKRFFGYSAEQFWSPAGEDRSPIWGGGWVEQLIRWMNVRLTRLQEFDRDAASLVVLPEPPAAAR